MNCLILYKFKCVYNLINITCCFLGTFVFKYESHFKLIDIFIIIVNTIIVLQDENPIVQHSNIYNK